MKFLPLLTWTDPSLPQILTNLAWENPIDNVFDSMPVTDTTEMQWKQHFIPWRRCAHVSRFIGDNCSLANDDSLNRFKSKQRARWQSLTTRLLWSIIPFSIHCFRSRLSTKNTWKGTSMTWIPFLPCQTHATTSTTDWIVFDLYAIWTCGSNSRELQNTISVSQMRNLVPAFHLVHPWMGLVMPEAKWSRPAHFEGFENWDSNARFGQILEHPVRMFREEFSSLTTVGLRAPLVSLATAGMHAHFASLATAGLRGF